MDELEASIRDLVIANRILAMENVVDAYGHVSIRHPLKPDHYLLSRSLSPGYVTKDDIIEFTLDGKPARVAQVNPDERKLFGSLGLLSSKPVLYVCNVEEAAAAEGNANSARVAARAAAAFCWERHANAS